MPKATLTIKDEVNVKFTGLDVKTRRKLSEVTKYFLPHAIYTPDFKLGRWNGNIYFCDLGGRTFFNLLDILIPIIIKAGYSVDVNDCRTKFSFDFNPVIAASYENIVWPDDHICAGLPIMLRDYQVDTINTFLKNPCGLQVIATGSGKTLITAVLSHTVEKYGKSIIIVPNKDLVVQTEKDYINMGLNVGVLFGDRKQYDKTHTICTWQSLGHLSKKSKKGISDIHIDKFLENVICVIVDECHKAKANILKELLTGPFAHVPIRWGLTGTIPKQEHEVVAIKCSLGFSIGQLKSKELRDQGILADIDIDIIQFQDEARQFKNYAQEIQWLTTDFTRLTVLSEIINTYTKSGNTLVLVDRIKTGEMLIKMNPDWAFINGKIKLDKRQKEYDEIASATNKVIVATYGTASTGINIPRIFNLFLFESGKSFVRVIQSIGRGIRKADDKDHLRVVDITSTLRFSRKHLYQRKKFYKEEDIRFKETKRRY